MPVQPIVDQDETIASRLLQTILLVDACPDTLTAVRMRAASWRLNVEQVQSAAEACHRILHNRYGLVLTEFELPDGNGAAVLKKVRAYEKAQKQGKPASIFALTDLWNIRRCNKMLKAGCTGFLRKPFEEEEFREVLLRSGMKMAHETSEPVGQSEAHFFDSTFHKAA